MGLARGLLEEVTVGIPLNDIFEVIIPDLVSKFVHLDVSEDTKVLVTLSPAFNDSTAQSFEVFQELHLK